MWPTVSSRFITCSADWPKFGKKIMPRKQVCLCAIPTLLLASAGQAQIALAPAVNYSTADTPDGIASLDVNGDGFLDLAVATNNPEKLSVLINRGDGTYNPPVNMLLGAGVGAGFVVASDVDGDGDMDVVVALHNASAVQVLLNNAGVFSMGQRVSVGQNPRSIVAADLNGNGSMDLAVANRDSDNATVLINNGAGMFAGTTYPAGVAPRGVTAMDVDMDGDNDLAITLHRDRTILVMMNAGNGTYTNGQLISVGGQLRPVGITSADFDSNGMPDLAVATSGNGLNFVSVLLNTAGTLAAPANFNSGGQNPSAIATADLDGDGSSDLVVSNPDSGNIGVLANNGFGSFGPATSIMTGSQASEITIGALDGNTSMDIAVTNTSASTTSVVLNLDTGCYADCDQSTGAGVLDIFDFLCFQDAFVAGDPYACDCDTSTGPGTCDVFDFLCFQDAFVGACP
jgi:FG-GAP-like repeat